MTLITPLPLVVVIVGFLAWSFAGRVLLMLGLGLLRIWRALGLLRLGGGVCVLLLRCGVFRLGNGVRDGVHVLLLRGVFRLGAGVLVLLLLERGVFLLGDGVRDGVLLPRGALWPRLRLALVGFGIGGGVGGVG